MKLLSVISVAAISLLVTACSKPTEAIIPSDMALWDKELAPVIQKLTPEDRQTVAAYLARVKMGEAFGGKGMPVGTTIGAAIAEQKTWATQQAEAQERERALAEKVKKDRAEAAEKIRSAVTVSLISKDERYKNYSAGRYSDVQVFKIAAKNNTEKNIKGIAGDLNFLDVFGKKIGVVGFTISEDIRPGQTYVWTGTRDYNEFLDAHKALWELSEDKYTTQFVPEGIVFSDGTKIVAE